MHNRKISKSAKGRDMSTVQKKGNEAAKKMYEKMGFYHTGKNDGNEIIMQMDL